MKLNNVLKYIAITGIFLIPFVPFVVSGSMFFPFITGKGFVFRIIVEIAFASYLILAINDRAYRPKKNNIFISLSVFVLIMFFAGILGESPIKSIWSNYERMEGWLLLAHLWALYVMMVSLFKDQKMWLNFFNVTLIASLIMCIYSAFQFFGWVEGNVMKFRLYGTFGNSSYLGAYLLLHFFLSLFMLIRNFSKDKILPITYGSLAVLQFVILLLTGTRGSFVGLAISIIIGSIILISSRESSGVVRRAGAIILILIAISIGGLYLAKDTNFIKSSQTLNRLVSIFDTKSAFSRTRLWNISFKGFSERPILGWGQDNFNYVYNKYYRPDMHDQEQWFDRAHNVFFDWLIAGGILGLLGYLALFLFGIVAIWRGKKFEMNVVEKTVWTGMFIAYFIHNFFVFDHLVSYVLFINMLAFMHFRTSSTDDELVKNTENIDSAKNKNKELKKPVEEEGFSYITPFVIVGLVFSVYFIVWKPFKTNITLINALKSSSLNERLSNFKKSLEYNTAYAQEIREQLMISTPYVVDAIKSGQVKMDNKVVAEWMNLTLKEMGNQIKDAPNDARAHYFRGQIYFLLNDNANAETDFKKALELSPDKQSFMYTLGQILLNQNKVNEAYEVLKRAYEVEKTNKQAEYLYAVISIFNGKAEENYSLIKKYLLQDESDERIINAFRSSDKNKNLFLKFMKELKKEYPDKVSVRLLLANAYLLVDQKWSAIEELKEAKKVAPGFSSQIDNIIKGIN